MQTGLEKLGDEELITAAFERVKGDLAALRPDELLQINLDIPTAVATVIGVLPEVTALRAQIAHELPQFDLVAFDKLEDYAWAFSYAQSLFLTATQPPDDLLLVAGEGTKLRERLLSDAQSLSQHGLVDVGQLAQVKGGNGYKSLAQDLQILSIVLRASWSNIQGKSPTTSEDLDTALRLSARLTRIVGLREQAPAETAEATDRRMRAFTLLNNVYEDARRAVGYLRSREGDADTIAPSLYPGRPRRKQPTPGGDGVTASPTNPTTTSVTGVAPASAADAQTARLVASSAGSHVSAPNDVAAKGPFLS